MSKLLYIIIIIQVICISCHSSKSKLNNDVNKENIKYLKEICGDTLFTNHYFILPSTSCHACGEEVLNRYREQNNVTFVFVNSPISEINELVNEYIITKYFFDKDLFFNKKYEKIKSFNIRYLNIKNDSCLNIIDFESPKELQNNLKKIDKLMSIQ